MSLGGIVDIVREKTRIGYHASADVIGLDAWYLVHRFSSSISYRWRYWSTMRSGRRLNVPEIFA